jgi:hypothetical protein
MYSPSGLFPRLCPSCGLRMQLPTLHTLVVVSYCLATAGFAEEDLFGAICLLVAMLQVPLNPTIRSHISVTALLGGDSDIACDHPSVSPVELAKRLSETAERSMTTQAKLGWDVFILILEHAEAVWDETDEANYSGPLTAKDRACLKYSECGYSCEDTDFYLERSSKLGHVFAVIQAEMLTYRRIQEGDSWVSPNFDMKEVMVYLSEGEELQIPLIKEGMMMDHCVCGRFGDNLFCRKDDTEVFHFSNLDDWSRTTIIDDLRWRVDV